LIEIGSRFAIGTKGGCAACRASVRHRRSAAGSVSALADDSERASGFQESTRYELGSQLRPSASSPDSRQRTTIEVHATTQAESLGHLLKPLASAGEESAEKATAGELLQPGLPGVRIATDSFEHAGQLTRD
jgi:hypothetical protein